MTSAPSSWAPPFCPNPKCPYHRGDTALWRHVKIGSYSRKTPPYTVQRRQCVTCRRTFGTQTFSATYWLHRPELLAPVFHRLVGCSGFRQIATEFNQYFPTSFHVAAGRLSRFFYGFTDTELRRKGRMTRKQRKKREELEDRL